MYVLLQHWLLLVAVPAVALQWLSQMVSLMKYLCGFDGLSLVLALGHHEEAVDLVAVARTIGIGCLTFFVVADEEVLEAIAVGILSPHLVAIIPPAWLYVAENNVANTTIDLYNALKPGCYQSLSCNFPLDELRLACLPALPFRRELDAGI